MASRAGLSGARKLKSLAIISAGGCAAFTTFAIIKGNQRFYDDLLMPSVRAVLDPENAHRAGVLLAKNRILPSWNKEYPELRSKHFNLDFRNCVGLAAGFDKDGEALEGLLDWGFGFVEIGSVTPVAQPGNEKPRVFRLEKEQGLINRYGFNSQGHESVKLNVSRHDLSDRKNAVIGINLGKNKSSDDAARDYCKGILEFGSVADYIVVNVSSPNTPGLRALQSKEDLKNLLIQVISARNKLTKKVPVLLKIAPDLLAQDKKDIAEVILMENCKIDGLIVSNTTISRPATLTSKEKIEIGGLSGKPVNALSTVTISDMYVLTDGKIPIIGVGGISNGKDAYAKIKAGASMVQILTTLVYRGPPVVETIKKELVDCLKADGYKHISEAVGSNHKMNELVSQLIRFKKNS